MGDMISSLLFQPPPPTYIHPSRHFWLNTSYGTRIPAFFIERPNAQVTILFSHGNAEDLGMIYDWFNDLARVLRVNIMAYGKFMFVSVIVLFGLRLACETTSFIIYLHFRMHVLTWPGYRSFIINMLAQTTLATASRTGVRTRITSTPTLRRPFGICSRSDASNRSKLFCTAVPSGRDRRATWPPRPHSRDGAWPV